MYYSPLRYPGGKRKIAEKIGNMVKVAESDMFAEPFAGGAAVALELLEKGIVGRIVLNDKDPAIFSFWQSAIYNSDRFIETIMTTPLTIDEWHRQREIVMTEAEPSFDLGFAAFYLNRTNRSGIIKGGIIGGLDQAGKYKMDVRFNRVNLAKRIGAIARRKDQISIYGMDARELIDKLPAKCFIFSDPPYIMKSERLYMNTLTDIDHRDIRDHICASKCDWIVTYDNVPIIEELYKDYPQIKFGLSYSAGTKRKGKEIMILKDEKYLEKSNGGFCQCATH